VRSFITWNIVRVITSMKMRLAGYVARTGQMGNIYTILAGIPEVKDHTEDLDINGVIILEWMLEN
jgi:hypothetical protein